MASVKEYDECEKVECCYNKSHIVLKHRLQTHLCKCRKQYPDKTLSLCPFNATHNVYTPELQFHIESCPDRRKLDSYVFSSHHEPGTKRNHPQVEIPASSENWDEEPDCVSYLNEKDKIISELPLLRYPTGKSRSLRKKFYLQESQKFKRLKFESNQDPPDSVNEKENPPMVPGKIDFSQHLRIGMGRGMKIELDDVEVPFKPPPSRAAPAPQLADNGLVDDEDVSIFED